MVRKQHLAAHVHDSSIFSSGGSNNNNNKKETTSPSSFYSAAWQWTSCGQPPRTLSSLRQQGQEAEGHVHLQLHHADGDQQYMPMMEQQMATTVNSTYDDDYSISCSTASEAEAEAVILQALRSDRLLYDEPADEDDGSSCCMLISKDSNDDTTSAGSMATKATAAAEAAATATVVAPAFGGATAMSVESQDPYRDFRESMEAMVMSQLQQVGVGEGNKDWHWLEEMLGWYLRANAKSTHGVIVGAFVDLLVALTTTTTSPPPPAAADNYSSSSSSSPPDTPAAGAATNCCSAASSSDCSFCSSS